MKGIAHARTFFVGALIVATVALPELAYPSIPRIFSMLELAEQSDVAFIGEVTAVDDDAATVAVAQILAGTLETDSVSVSSVYTEHNVERSINFSVGSEALVLAKKTDDQHLTIVGLNQGKIDLGPENREMEIAAAKWILATIPLEEHRKNKAMLAEVKSENARIRKEARRYVAQRISHSKLKDRYAEDLVSLIEDADTEIQRTGLQGIQFVRAPESIPRIVELTRSENWRIVFGASRALAKYDTKGSVAALVALTKHQDYRINIRAVLDLAFSRRPEAKAAVSLLLDNKDPKVRVEAAKGLIHWLRRNQASDVLPKLIEMLEDTDLDARCSAAETLGECRNSDLVPPLLEILKKEPLSTKMKRSVLRALHNHHSKGDAKAKKLIDDNIHLFIAVLKEDQAKSNWLGGIAFTAVGSLDVSKRPEAKEALRWAAQSHPSDMIRSCAQWHLSIQQKKESTDRPLN